MNGLDFMGVALLIATGFSWGFISGRGRGYRVGHADGVRRRRLIENQVSK